MFKLKWLGFGNSKQPMPAPSTVAAVKEVPLCPDGTQTHGKRVLIVDDDPVFLKATARKLQSAGLQVKTARESSEAIAALNEQPVDAVLIDITFEPDVANGGMASWDGFQLMTWLRGNPSAKGARFIMVSGSDLPSDRQRAKRLGAVAYFQKPLDHDQLIAAVNPEN